jgi:GNAT superfamily N-acetyltransferase
MRSIRVFDVCPIVPHDAEAIARLWIVCTTEVAASDPIYRLHISAELLAGQWHAAFENGRMFGWVVEAQGVLAGYATCQIQGERPLFTPRTYVYINDLDVTPEFRELRLSRVLMQEVERDARLRGIHRLELGVAKNSLKIAERFVPVFRGRCRKPLFVSAIGYPVEKAALQIEWMHDYHRIPTLLKLADQSARTVPPLSMIVNQSRSLVNI